MIQCKGCDKKFNPKIKKQKFCNIKCSRKYASKSYQYNHRNDIKFPARSVFYYKNRIKRLCLGGCNKLFLSEGIWNRVCLICKGGYLYDKGNVLYENM